MKYVIYDERRLWNWLEFGWNVHDAKTYIKLSIESLFQIFIN